MDQKKSFNRYAWDKSNRVQLSVKFMQSTDNDIINQINKRTSEGYTRLGYVKSLIRYDIDNDILPASTKDNDLDK